MDPKSLLSNLKRTFSGFGGQVPGAKPPAPFAIPKPAPFAFPKPAPFAMPTPGPTPTYGPAPAPSLTPMTAPPQASGAFIGPVRPATPVMAPPVASSTPTAPVVPTTSTGQTINTATGGIVAGATPVVAPPAPTIPTPVVPEAPTAPSAEQSAVTSAEQAYKTAGAMSPEQDATQAELDRLAESVRGGYEGAGQQAIPMEFITGQQKAIEQRGLRLSEPLAAKLARMEAKRLSGLETSKFALERADKALSTTSAAKTAEATAKESARRFGIEQSGTAETRALAEKKFNEDNRQFGLDYAIKQREVGIKEAEAKAKAGDQGGGEIAIAGARDTITQIQGLIDSKGMKGSVGPYGLSRWTPLSPDKTERINFIAGIQQITSQLTLDKLVQAKAAGATFGALSDGERVVLAGAATKLNTFAIKDDQGKTIGYEAGEQDFKDELTKIQGLAQKDLERRTRGTGAAQQPQYEGYVLKADGKYYPK